MVNVNAFDPITREFALSMVESAKICWRNKAYERFTIRVSFSPGSDDNLVRKTPILSVILLPVR